MNEWLATAMASAASSGSEDKLERAKFVREQLEVLQRYCGVCKTLAAYDQQTGDMLVSTTFPIRLLPKTHEYLVQGLGNSLAGFVKGVHMAVLTTNVSCLERGQSHNLGAYVEWTNTLAADFWTQYSAILDGTTTAETGRGLLLRMLEEFAFASIREEVAKLRVVHSHYVCIRDACALFSRRMLKGKKAEEAEARRKVARGWLASASQNGARSAIHALSSRVSKFDTPCMISAFRSTEHLDDDTAEALYSCMETAHEKLATAMTLEIRRLDWLLSAPSDSPCWSGVIIIPDSCDHESDERILTAPAHLAVFATGRLRVAADPRALQAAYQCGLATVRVARLLAQLLRNGHLPVDKLGLTFAKRVVVYEFAKYEQAAMRIEDETLVPFGKEVGVSYVPGAVSAALLSE